MDYLYFFAGLIYFVFAILVIFRMLTGIFEILFQRFRRGILGIPREDHVNQSFGIDDELFD